MHGGFIFGDHTTCSYVASLNNNKNTYWVTGSSTPCIAVFKPLWLVDEEPITFSESDQAGAVDYWQMRERLHRMFLENTVIDPAAFLIARDKLETELYQKVAKLDLINVCREDLLEIMKYALEAEERLIKKTIADSTGKRPVITGNIYYKYYWHRQNKRLASKKQMLFPPVE